MCMLVFMRKKVFMIFLWFKKKLSWPWRLWQWDGSIKQHVTSTSHYIPQFINWSFGNCALLPIKYSMFVSVSALSRLALWFEPHMLFWPFVHVDRCLFYNGHLPCTRSGLLWSLRSLSLLMAPFLIDWTMQSAFQWVSKVKSVQTGKLPLIGSLFSQTFPSIATFLSLSYTKFLFTLSSFFSWMTAV